MNSVAYSPDGRHIISGSDDKTIRIWDAETGAAVGTPLEEHTDCVNSVAYSPDGRHIISGSYDTTIRVWDAEPGAAVGTPLHGHIHCVNSLACSPNCRHIISAPDDMTIRLWYPATRNTTQNPPIEHTSYVQPFAYPSKPQQHFDPSHHTASQVSDIFPPLSVHITHCSTMHAVLNIQPDSEGWVRDTTGGLLYWVPPDCRRGLHSPALLTIPRESDIRSVSLNFDNFAFGTSWAHIFN